MRYECANHRLARQANKRKAEIWDLLAGEVRSEADKEALHELLAEVYCPTVISCGQCDGVDCEPGIGVPVPAGEPTMTGYGSRWGGE